MGQRLNGYWLAEVVSATVNPDGSATVYFLVKQGLNNATWPITAAQRQAIMDGTYAHIVGSYVNTGMVVSLDEAPDEPYIVLRLTDLQSALAIPNGGNGNGNGGNGNGGNGNGTGVKTGISPMVIAIGAIAVVGLILLMQRSKTTGG